MSYLLVLLTIVPVSFFHLFKVFSPKRRWMYTGVALGLVIAPISYGLIKFTFVPVVGALLGFVGLFFNMIHGSVGYFCLISVGMVEPSAVLSVSELVMINLLNAAIWSFYYGIIGFNIDKKLASAEDASAGVPVEETGPKVAIKA